MPAEQGIEPGKPARSRKSAGAGPARRTKTDEAAAAPPARTRRVRKIDPEERRRCIAEAAYFRAEQRGFAPGREMDDWLQAEIEFDRLQQHPAAR